jgi:UDP-N-acetylglucosamine pyrophosphorylase
MVCTFFINSVERKIFWLKITLEIDLFSDKDIIEIISTKKIQCPLYIMTSLDRRREYNTPTISEYCSS